MSKFYLLLEAQMNDEALEKLGLKQEDVLKRIVVQDSDVIDGFEIFPQGLGLDVTSDFTLKSASAKILTRGLGQMSPIKKFIEEEVPFRFAEILELPTERTVEDGYTCFDEEIISEDEMQEIIKKVIRNQNIMFDYDMFDEFLVGLYENNDRAIVKAKFTSEWDGGYRVTTPCKVNLRTKKVFDIEVNDEVDGLEVLDIEYITLNGVERRVYPENEAEQMAENVFWYE